MQGCRCMNYFKHLKSGMSLIEVMIALALFATFGSSLFMMQQYIFDRLIQSHIKLQACLRMQEELAAYQIDILKQFFDYEHGSVKKSLEAKNKNFTAPDMIVSITTKSDFVADNDEKESPFKTLKNIHLISVRAHEIQNEEKLYGKSFVFVYIPDSEKQRQ